MWLLGELKLKIKIMGKLDRFKKIISVNSSQLLAGDITTPKPAVSPLNRGILVGEINKIPLSRGQDKVLGVVKSGVNIEAMAEFGRINYNPTLNPRSKKMSREMTKSECNIWFNLLSKRQLLGYKFTRQKIVFNYILDFYCSELLLAIEIDGDTHSIEYDKVRDSFIESIGITTLRFSNSEALQNLNGIKQSLEKFIKNQKNNQKITNY
jgi:very-short-patch-repair endonuclease